MTVGLGSFYETCPKGLSLDSSSLLNCRPSLHSPPSPSSPFPLPFPLLTVEPIKRIRIYIKNSFKLLEENEKGNLWVHFNENIYEQMYEMYYWGNFTNRTLLFVFCFVFYFELREQEGHNLIVLNFCFSSAGHFPHGLQEAHRQRCDVRVPKLWLNVVEKFNKCCIWYAL